MNFRPPGNREIDINLTPLIDVVFLLLIFFMVSTTFVKESEIDLTLPQASAELREDPGPNIQIAVDRNGDIFVNDQGLINTQVTTIRQALADARGDADDPVVIISADAAASHQRVVDIMDAARQAGLFRITFPTRLRPEE